jgi:hypothetical protein
MDIQGWRMLVLGRRRNCRYFKLPLPSLYTYRHSMLSYFFRLRGCSKTKHCSSRTKSGPAEKRLVSARSQSPIIIIIRSRIFSRGPEGCPCTVSCIHSLRQARSSTSEHVLPHSQGSRNTVSLSTSMRASNRGVLA